jgi:exosortase D (VPLPA-CTERM-specific)
MTALYSTTGDGLHRRSRRAALLTRPLLAGGFAALCLALMCLSARDGLQNLYDRWMYEEEYGYGFLIAALVPLLLWRRWQTLVSESGGARWPGVVILLLAQLSSVIAALGESYFIEQIALIISMMGIGLIVFGWGAMRTLLPISVLLLLTIPLPYTLQAMLTIKLQLISTDLGVTIIQLLGIPVYVEGNIIDLGSYKLQVTEACSGLRYLLPLVCMSFLVAYLYKAAFWKKVVVVISAAPITIVINSFRIAVTALLVNNFGTQMADGFIHQFEGWIIFLVGVALLGFEIFALEGFRWSKVEIESIVDRRPIEKQPTISRKIALPLFLAVAVCVGTFGLETSIAAAQKSLPAPVRESFASFPQRIDRWVGRPSALEPEILGVLKDTDTYSGDFVEETGDLPVNLFVAYYDSLSKGAAIHSPRVCLPGSGWEFASFEQRKFGELIPGATGTYNYTLLQKGEQKILMYYWYQQRARRTADEFQMKYFLLLDSFFLGRKDGALVRLYTPVSASAGRIGEAQANARLQSFAQSLFSKMPTYLPE